MQPWVAAFCALWESTVTAHSKIKQFFVCILSLYLILYCTQRANTPMVNPHRWFKLIQLIDSALLKQFRKVLKYNFEICVFSILCNFLLLLHHISNREICFLLHYIIICSCTFPTVIMSYMEKGLKRLIHHCSQDHVGECLIDICLTVLLAFVAPVWYDTNYTSIICTESGDVT